MGALARLAMPAIKVRRVGSIISFPSTSPSCKGQINDEQARLTKMLALRQAAGLDPPTYRRL
jgi:hypothetical protein